MAGSDIPGSTTSAEDQTGQPGKVRGVQEESTTKLVAGLRELLSVTDMRLKEQDFIVNSFRIMSLFRELDAKMSSGDYELPDQWNTP
jgi:hypothetical protein